MKLIYRCIICEETRSDEEVRHIQQTPSQEKLECRSCGMTKFEVEATV